MTPTIAAPTTLKTHRKSKMDKRAQRRLNRISGKQRQVIEGIPTLVQLDAQTISDLEIHLLMDYADKVERKDDVLECTFTNIEECEGDSVKLEVLQGLIVTHDIRSRQVQDAVVTTGAA